MSTVSRHCQCCVRRRHGHGRAGAVLLAALCVLASAFAAGQESLRGPDVTIIQGEERTLYEYRQNGELRMVKVVPAFGPPYFLVPADPTTGDGLERADELVARWVLFEF